VLAQSITDPARQAEALAGVAVAVARAGDRARVQVLAKQAEATVRLISNPRRQARVLADLAEAAARTGDLNRAQVLSATLFAHRLAAIDVHVPAGSCW